LEASKVCPGQWAHRDRSACKAIKARVGRTERGVHLEMQVHSVRRESKGRRAASVCLVCRDLPDSREHRESPDQAAMRGKQENLESVGIQARRANREPWALSVHRARPARRVQSDQMDSAVFADRTVNEDPQEPLALTEAKVNPDHEDQQALRGRQVSPVRAARKAPLVILELQASRGIRDRSEQPAILALMALAEAAEMPDLPV